MRFGLKEVITTALMFTPVARVLAQTISPAQDNSGLAPYKPNDLKTFWNEAITTGNEQTLNTLLESGCTIDPDRVSNALFERMLHYAQNIQDNIYHSQISLVKKLIANGANVNTKFSYNQFSKQNSPFELAIMRGDMNVFNAMLPNATITIDSLHLAMKLSRYEMIKTLVENGAPIGSGSTRTLLCALKDKTVKTIFNEAAIKKLTSACQATKDNALVARPGI